jgi:Trk-type K+ transport system membrane component
MNLPIDAFTLLVMGLLLPLLQLVSLMALWRRHATSSKRRARLHFVYFAMVSAMVPWITDVTFSLILLNLWNANHTARWAIDPTGVSDRALVCWTSDDLTGEQGMERLTIGLTHLRIQRHGLGIVHLGRPLWINPDRDN